MAPTPPRSPVRVQKRDPEITADRRQRSAPIREKANHAAGTHLVENVLQALLRQSRALHILHRAELPSEPLSLVWSHRSLLLPRQLLQHLGVIPQVDLGADDEAGHARTVVADLREPFLLYVLEGGWRCYTKAHKKHVRLRVRQRPESIVILLAWSKSVWWIANIVQVTHQQYQTDRACMDLPQS